MKKIMLALAVAVLAVAANAASFNWSAANIYGADLTNRYNGEVSLYAVIDGVDTLVSTATAANGVVKATATEFSNDSLKAGNYYDFFITVTAGEKTFTSSSVNIAAQQSDVATIAFGNMATQTQNAANWTTASVPEPTSGLLMLVGLAGLALRRRRA